jgi:hypothetical protein
LTRTLFLAPSFRAASALFCAAVAILGAALAFPASAQQPKSPADAKPAEKNPTQIELLETKVRFESNGDSRKEVHARVRIHNELGARQFAKLNFDFNRNFQAVEIPIVRITHASGGTADILPGAITDNPNPAVVDFPAYHDVRVKSIRILGLQPDDLLEYRVITTTTHHPLAPDFWLDHTFDRSGVVTDESFQLELPTGLRVGMKLNPEISQEASRSLRRNDTHSVYRWNHNRAEHLSPVEVPGPDISISTFKSWDQLASKLAAFLFPTQADIAAVKQMASQSVQGSAGATVESYYKFVSQKIRTVDLPLEATGFRSRKPADILQSTFATAEDKFVLFAALSEMTKAGLVADSPRQSREIPSPTQFNYLVTLGQGAGSPFRWLDLNAEVAPIGMLPARFRGQATFVIEWPGKDSLRSHWEPLLGDSPFQASQLVSCSGTFDRDGNLNAKVQYRMRGENELLLRIAFHKTAKERWKDVAQLLALSDGFRGDITNVAASDPYETEKPFEVEYELRQSKFADWTKKTHHIPALLPVPGLPDPPTAESISKDKPIELGTPLSIDLESAITLPEGATAQAPIGTSVTRDYAAFSSKYSVAGNVLRATRKLNFLLREIPSSRAADFNAFLHAVQSDQAQFFTVQAPAQK